MLPGPARAMLAVAGMGATILGGPAGDPDPVSGVLLPALLRGFDGSPAVVPKPWTTPGAVGCIEGAAMREQTLANLSRVSSSIRKPPGDPLLILRAALRRLAATLTHLSGALSRCLAEQGEEEDGANSARGFDSAVTRLGGFVADGKINDGLCPFTGKRQTTIGGADVRRDLSHFTASEWDSNNIVSMKKASKALGKLLRKVRDADGKDPPGSPPVNWQIRAAMFGRGIEEL